MTISAHHASEFARAAQAMYARGENALGHLLSATSACKTVPDTQFALAHSAYCAWLAFNDPKGGSR